MGYKSPWHPTTSFLIFLASTATSSLSQPLPPPPTPSPPPDNYAFKPSITILIGMLTTIFSITFLLLLYTKHCRRSQTRYGQDFIATGSIDRGNSGIDRTIIESLPVFRFGSLSGQKDGLECAVCLSVFDPSEVLRLLPKCKHAFHVECVDTWLDAHSTCPLCRYRVDPEDIFLIIGGNDHISRDTIDIEEEKEVVRVRRVSGRHSSAGEKVTGLLQISVETETEKETETETASSAAIMAGSRRSLDSWKKKSGKKAKKKEGAVVTAERHRKDGMLLSAVVVAEEGRRRVSFEKRFSHRIVVGTGGVERWSDVQPSDLLYLRSEMILSDVRRLKRSRPSVLHEGNNGWWQGGRGVINTRSVSEMTGLSRFGSNEEAGVVSRLLARLSEPKSGRNSSSSNV